MHDEVSESEANRDATSYWWFREYREFDCKFIDYGMKKIGGARGTLPRTVHSKSKYYIIILSQK